MVAATITKRTDANSQGVTPSPDRSLQEDNLHVVATTPSNFDRQDIRAQIRAGAQARAEEQKEPLARIIHMADSSPEAERAELSQKESQRQPNASGLTESEKQQASIIVNEARALARDEGMNFQRRATGLQPEAISSLSERLRAKGVELSVERLNSDPQLAQVLLESKRSGFDEGRSMWTKAHDASAKLYNAMYGWGTDEAAIFQALEGKTPDEIRAIHSAFKANYNADLDKWLKSELGGSDLVRAQTLMQGDPKLGAAAELYWAMKGSGTDEAAINRILSRSDAAEVEKIFNERFAKQYGASNLKAALQLELGADDLTQAQSLLASNDPTASEERRNAAKIRADAAELHKAMKGGVTGAGTDESTVHAVLDRNAARGGLEQLKQEYQRLYNSELRTHLKGELSFNDEKRAVSLLNGDKVAADAIALQSAEWGWGVDREQVRAVLENSTDAHRQAVLSQYRDMRNGRDFVESARSQVSTDAATVIEAFAKNGKLSAAQELLDSMTDTGTNEGRLLQHVEGKSKAEIEQIRREYKEMTNRELDNDVNWEVSGDVQFDMTEALRGRPESLDEIHSAIERRYSWERSGINLLSDIWTDQGKVLDRQIEATRRHVTNIQNGTASGEDVEILRAQYDVQKVHAEAFRAAKDAITNNAATVVTTAVAVGSVIATGGTALGFWATVGIAAASSAVARIGTKVALKGSRYNGVSEMLIDVGISAIEAATAKAGAVVTKFLGTTAPMQRLAAIGTVGRASAAAIEGAVDGTGSGFIAGTGEAVLTTDFSEMSAGQIASNITTRGGFGALGGGVGGSVLSGGLTVPVEKLVGKRAAGEVAQEVVGDAKLSTTTQRVGGEEPAFGTASKPTLDESRVVEMEGVPVLAEHKAGQSSDPSSLAETYGGQGLEIHKTGKAVYVSDAALMRQQYEKLNGPSPHSEKVAAFFDRKHNVMVIQKPDATSKESRVIGASFIHHEYLHSKGMSEADAYRGQAEFLRKNGMYLSFDESGPVITREPVPGSSPEQFEVRLQEFLENNYSESALAANSRIAAGKKSDRNNPSGTSETALTAEQNKNHAARNYDAEESVAGMRLAKGEDAEQDFQALEDGIFTQALGPNAWRTLDPNNPEQLSSFLSLYHQLTDPKNPHATKLRQFLGLDSRDLLQEGPAFFRDASVNLTRDTRIPARGPFSFSDVDRHPQNYIVQYHGTDANGARAISTHGIDPSRGGFEFGPGFYTTSSPHQAMVWAKMKAEETTRATGQHVEPMVVRVIIPKTEITKVYEAGRYLSFPTDPHLYMRDRDVLNLFTNFDQTARMMGSQKPNPTSQIDLITGPLIKMADEVESGQVVHKTADQLRIADTPVGNKLLSDSYVDVVSVNPRGRR